MAAVLAKPAFAWEGWNRGAGAAGKQPGTTLKVIPSIYRDAYQAIFSTPSNSNLLPSSRVIVPEASAESKVKLSPLSV